MLNLPIKRKWLDMIMSGEKKEEYREIKHYYTVRIRNLMTSARLSDEFTIEVVRAAGDKGIPYKAILRGGYSLFSPVALVAGRVVIGNGRPEWGAEAGKEYYVLRIKNYKCIILGYSDSKKREKQWLLENMYTHIDSEQSG